MVELVPIKIKVTQDSRGHFVYPQFKKKLLFFKNNPDYKGLPLYYDKKSDCQTCTEGSPYGMRWCMKLVPLSFAEEALAMFPYTVFEMTEDEAEKFYDENAMAHMQDNIYDTNTLMGLQLELDLKEKLGQNTTDVKIRIARAIDPDDETPGIKRNRYKRWQDLKINMNMKAVRIKRF